MAVTHAFVNPKADGGDTTVTRPSNWNADHAIDGTVTFTTSGSLLAPSGSGAYGLTIGIPGTTAGDYIKLQAGSGIDLFVSNIIICRVSTGGFNLASGINGQINWSISGAGFTPDTAFVGGITAGVIEQRYSTQAQSFRVYNTYTDASNYERATISWASNALTVAAEAAGTGSKRNAYFGTIDAGSFTSNAYFGLLASANSLGYGIICDNGGRIQFYPGYNSFSMSSSWLRSDPDVVIGWVTTGPSNSGWANDAGLGRNAAGVVEVNNGTKGTLADLKARDVKLSPSASLTPAANGDLVIQATSNTSLTFKYKGSDGTVRSASLTLT